jgi:hypothetical protein
MPVLLIAALLGCASSDRQRRDAQQHFIAGQEEAFAALQRSGIRIVRVAGPFQRPIVPWHEGMTLAQVILAAGYLEPRDPSQILIQRGPTALSIDPGKLLRGEDVPVESGDIIRVTP